MDAVMSFIDKFMFSKVKKQLDELTTRRDPLPGLHPTLKLPRIIVVGDENSGKSSILERICGLEVFPRGRGITTRLPTLLSLQHDPVVLVPKITVTLPGQPIQTDLTAAQARQLVEQENQRIREGPGIDKDNMVIIGVTSAQVLTIDLVDLPGIIAIQVEQRLAELSKECTEKYLADVETGVVVCVLDAHLFANLRTSTTVKLIQGFENIQPRTIGVFTRIDKVHEPHWEEEVGGTGPMWKVEKLLLKDPSMFPDPEFYLPVFKVMGGGFVGVKNRDTQSKKPVDLAASAEDEMNWLLTRSGFSTTGPQAFLQNVAGTQTTNGDANNPEPLSRVASGTSTCTTSVEYFPQKELSSLGKVHLGLPALMTRIDWMFNQHLNASWVPEQLKENAKERADLQQSLAALGKDPATINLDNSGDLFAVVKDRIGAVFTREKIDALAGSASFDFANFSWEPLGDGSCFTRMAALGKLHTQMEEHLNAQSSVLVTAFATSLGQEVKACFDLDVTGDWQLHRFHTLRDTLAGSIKEAVLHHGNDFGAQASAVVKVFFLSLMSMQPHPTGDEVRRTLGNALANCLMLSVAVSVLTVSEGSFSFIQDHTAALTAPNPVEACAERRSELLERLKKTEEYERVITTLGQTSL